MPKFEPGREKNGGRSKGVPNKTTQKARVLIMNAIDEQSIYFGEVMEKVKQKDPKEWAKIMVKLMDFVLPKKIDVTTDGESINKEPTKITLANGTVIDL